MDFDEISMASTLPEMNLYKGRRLHSGTILNPMDETDGIK